MADIRITQLPELTTPTDDDILPIIDSPASGATTKKITKANVVASTVATITVHTSRTDNPHTVTKAQVGLGSAENTADSAKPVSTATQTALDAKAALVHAHAQSDVTGLTTALAGKEPSITSGTTAQYYRGDKTFQTLDKAAVGLPLVTNIDATARVNHTGTQSADSLVDGTTSKAFLATERTKLAGVATGATANATDATLLNRANHTGTQSADTLVDGTSNVAFLATERAKLAGIATGASTSVTAATNKGAVYATGATTATSTAALTDGQILVGSSAGNPAPATITAGTGITVTNAANAITIAASGGSTAARYHVTVPFENLAAYQNLTGGSATVVNNSGYIQLQTGGTADSYVILGKNYGGSSMPSTTMQNITGYARLVLNTGNGEINYRFFTDNSNLSVSTAKQAGFRTAGGNLYASSGNGTTEQATLLTAPASNTFAAYSAECLDGTSVKFYVDGVLVATHMTSVPPAASGATTRLCVPGIKMTNYAANNFMAIWVADAGYSYQPY
jgi:hypothetical protein